MPRIPSTQGKDTDDLGKEGPVPPVWCPPLRGLHVCGRSRGACGAWCWPGWGLQGLPSGSREIQVFLQIPREITGETGQTGKRTTVLLQELERNHPTRTWWLGNPRCGMGSKSTAVRGSVDVFGKRARAGGETVRWGSRPGSCCRDGNARSAVYRESRLRLAQTPESPHPNECF